MKHKGNWTEDVEIHNTVRFSLYKDYKASKGFRGAGE